MPQSVFLFNYFLKWLITHCALSAREIVIISDDRSFLDYIHNVYIHIEL